MKNIGIMMITYDKHWLNKEISSLKKTIKSDKENKADTKIMFYYLLISCCCFFAGISAQQCIICPHCDNNIDVLVEGTVKSGSWTCPRKGCGYVNDNRIRYCSMCGSERQ
jgi:hypothetical protein